MRVGSSVAKQRESIVVFIKDTIMYNNKRLEEYRSLETMVRLASSSNGFGCYGSPPKHASAYHDTTKLSQFRIGRYKRLSKGYSPNGNLTFKSSYFNLGAYWLAINLTLKSLYLCAMEGYLRLQLKTYTSKI